MKGSKSRPRMLPLMVFSGLAAGMIGLSGCQVDVGGQTLPSPYYMYDDVQYFPTGPEFKLAREAAVMKAAAEEQALRGR